MSEECIMLQNPGSRKSLVKNPRSVPLQISVISNRISLSCLMRTMEIFHHTHGPVNNPSRSSIKMTRVFSVVSEPHPWCFVCAFSPSPLVYQPNARYYPIPRSSIPTMKFASAFALLALSISADAHPRPSKTQTITVTASPSASATTCSTGE